MHASTVPATAPMPPAARPSPRLWLGIAAFCLALAAAGYAWRGTPEGWSVAPGSATSSTAESSATAAQAQQIEGMLNALADRLKKQPNDPDSWLMLGRSYAVLGRFEQAIPAYREVLRRRPNDAQAMADLADALAVSNGRSLAGEPTRLISAALKADPDNPKALSLAGTLAFEAKDYAGAVRHWERALAQVNPESGLAQQLQDGVAEARQLGSLPSGRVAAAQPTGAAAQTATPVGAAPPVAGAAWRGLSGRISLAPALASKASPTDTVFIFARPAAGRGMPLALLKKQVKDLPLDFTLDDSHAMSPGNALSSASQVVLGARISKSGDALPHPGDLQSLSAPVATGSRGLKLEIADVVP